MSCSKECLCMHGEGYIVAAGHSLVFPSAVHHLHSDHTGRMTVLLLDTQLVRNFFHH